MAKLNRIVRVIEAPPENKRKWYDYYTVEMRNPKTPEDAPGFKATFKPEEYDLRMKLQELVDSGNITDEQAYDIFDLAEDWGMEKYNEGAMDADQSADW